MAELKSSAYGRRLLEQSPLFTQMDENSRRDLIGQAIPRSFGPGETVCRIGDPGGSMMAVLAGTVRISLPTVRGKEIILGDLHTGELFGEIALLDGKPRSANATALTKCELLVLERRNVIPFLERNPAACLQLMELLCARIRRSDERMADLAFFDLPSRLAKALLARAQPGPVVDRCGSATRRGRWRRSPAAAVRMSTATSANGRRTG